MYGSSWTLGKWILHLLGLIVWIALGNVVLCGLLFGWDWIDGFFVLQMVGNTLLVGIFPIVFSGLMVQLRSARSFQQEASTFNAATPMAIPAPVHQVSLPVQAQQTLDIDPGAIRYAEAMQNYVSVFYWQDGSLRRELIRSTLSSLEEAFSDTAVIRCHRSFLVNSTVIESVSGNAQGLKLQVADVPDTYIPVSRSYIPTLKAHLQTA